MLRNENQTCRELIEPALRHTGWSWDWQLVIGPGQFNLDGHAMYDQGQSLVVDYLLRLWQMPLTVLEAKSETADATDAIQQGSLYARRLRIRFSIASNGHQYIRTYLQFL